MEALPNNPNGIPVVVSGIPTVQTQEGIVSPFPYLNPDSAFWKDEDGQDGLDEGGGITVLDPHRDPDDLGGNEEEFEDDEDIDDDPDTGFGVGIGLLSTLFTPQAPFLPA